MNKHEALASLNSETGFFRHWMGRALVESCGGETD